MKEIYVVIQDNGEDDELYEEWIDKIFSNKDKAKEYIVLKTFEELLNTNDYNGNSWSMEAHYLNEEE